MSHDEQHDEVYDKKEDSRQHYDNAKKRQNQRGAPRKFQNDKPASGIREREFREYRKEEEPEEDHQEEEGYKWRQWQDRRPPAAHASEENNAPKEKNTLKKKMLADFETFWTEFSNTNLGQQISENTDVAANLYTLIETMMQTNDLEHFHEQLREDQMLARVGGVDGVFIPMSSKKHDDAWFGQ